MNILPSYTWVIKFPLLGASITCTMTHWDLHLNPHRKQICSRSRSSLDQRHLTSCRENTTFWPNQYKLWVVLITMHCVSVTLLILINACNCLVDTSQPNMLLREFLSKSEIYIYINKLDERLKKLGKMCRLHTNSLFTLIRSPLLLDNLNH